VLAGMVKRIDSELQSAALFDPASLAEAKGLLA
jgi:[acyl-carrier-protein] S-malonyltransferase